MEWKPVKDFEVLYEVSDVGEVRSIDRIVTDSKGRTRLFKGQLVKPFVSGGGYLQVRLHKDGVRYQPYLHKIVATAFIDNPFGYEEVNHINHNKLDASVENLEWCNRSQNMKSAVNFYKNISPSEYNQYSKPARLYNCIDCGESIHVGAKRCVPCYKVHSRLVERPNAETLRVMLKEGSFSSVGKAFGVSDNAVRKWCKFYGMSTKSKDYK